MTLERLARDGDGLGDSFFEPRASMVNLAAVIIFVLLFIETSRILYVFLVIIVFSCHCSRAKS